ncbi:extracellular solute-binding protein [Pseudorhodoferax soli]|uniref:Carbohydrate ABC transporter substrate-binding protein (CUT1 family) n=1 Tax=Pseudorhodoferax soli TaxID=545864 RepID=A0A368YBV2_9BURK|nr:extracellular solute-binding protein [Pseudorhodoferax soli]RCW75674.1 carbohydrate ABC transporter substrate-binding protein (CUT1 family) [Pseudorhodoferax soli]
MRRRTLLLGTGASVALSGCTASSGRQPLQFWAMGREAEVVRELLPGFAQRHPGIAVQVQQIPWSSAHEKLLTAYVGNSLPDVFQLGNTWIAEMAQLGVLAPLQARVQASTVVDTGDYFPGILATNRAARIAARAATGAPALLGLPWYVDTRLLFYRRDLLAQAGFAQMAQDWAGWAQMLEALKLRLAGQGKPMFLAVNEFEPLLALALQQDEGLLREQDTRGNFSNPGFGRALDFYSGFFRRGWADLQGKEQISNLWTEFGKGRFAFFVSGPWNMGELKRRLPPQQQASWGCAALPGPNGPGASIAGGASLVVHSRSPRQDAAWRLVEYLNEPAVQARFHGLTGNLPSRRSAWPLAGLHADERASAFADQLQRVKPAPAVLEWERIAVEMQRAAEQLVRGGDAATPTLAALDAQVDAILAKRRWLLQPSGEGRA